MSKPGDGRETSTRILLIDDEEPILYAMKEYFGAIGCQVDCARDGEEAEAMLAGARYSGAIVDLQLSVQQRAEGLGILSTLHERSPETKVILLTAHGSPEIEKEARRRGAGSFLEKPTSLGDLAGVMFRLLGESDEKPAAEDPVTHRTRRP